MDKEDFLRVSVQLVINLVKHAATLGMGDGARKVITETWLDFFDSETIEKFNKWLEQPKTLEKINQAIEQTEACFRSDSSKAHPNLKDAIHRYRGLSLVNLPGFQEKIEAWPKAPEETSWESVIFDIFKQDFGHHFSDQELNIAARQYALCLRKHLAMLADDTFTPRLVADGIARNQQMLAGLEESLSQVQSTVQKNFDMLAIGAERQHVLRPFITHYLGTPDGRKPPRPFGGRDPEIDGLNQWLFDQRIRRYALLVAKAGMGKSALLVHWLKSLRIDPKFQNWELVYYPISARFRTNLESEVLSSIAAELGGLHRDPVSAAKEGMDYRGLIYKYLNDVPLPEGKQLLIVVDGLDESSTPQLPEILFPFAPPDNVHILMAARTMSDGRKWQDQLGWASDWLQPFMVDGLSEAGIADVLFRMGNPLAHLGNEASIIEQLYRLSDKGDPFLVELYIQELLKDSDKLIGFQVDDLANLQPGLAGFFEKWIEDQSRIWGGDNPFEKPHIQAFKNLCAFAKGPLRIYDFLQLAPKEFNNQARLVKQAAKTFERFIIGDGNEQGYVFTHPRLAQYFAAEEAHQASDIQNQFLAYGTSTLQGLEEKQLNPLHARDDFAYIVQHYSDHLDEVKAAEENYYSLISEGWLLAWEALEGTNRGFLSDVDKAWEKAKFHGSKALDIQILAALCHASIVSRSSNIGGELLMALWEFKLISNAQLQNSIVQITNKLVRAGAVLACWDAIKSFPEDVYEHYKMEIKESIDQYLPWDERGFLFAEFAKCFTEHEKGKYLSEALAASRQMRDEESRAELLSTLAPHLNKDQLSEALVAVRQIKDEDKRTQLLTTLVSHLDKEQLSEAWVAVRQIKSEERRAQLLITLVAHLDKEQLSKALTAAWLINNEERRAKVLTAFVPYLDEQDRPAVLSEALAAARQISDGDTRTERLTGLVPYLDQQDRPVVLSEALAAARQISDRDSQTERLTALIPYFDEQDRPAVSSEAMVAASVMTDGRRWAEVLIALAPHLDKEQLGEALAAARQLDDGETQAKELMTLAPYLDEQDRPAVLSEALAATKQISDGKSRAELLTALVPYLDEQDRPVVSSGTLAVAEQLGDERSWAKALIALAPHLDHEQLGEALTAAGQIKYKWYQQEVLIALAPHLAHEQLSEALAAARQLGYAGSGEKVLIALAPNLDHDQLSEALTATWLIKDEWHQARILKGLAPHLEKNQLSEALATAEQIKDELHQARILKGLAPHLEKNQLSEALAAAGRISDEGIRIQLLSGLVSHLDQEQLSEALTAAWQISDEEQRAQLLTTLVSHLDQERLREALATAGQIKDEWNQATTLSILAPHMDKRLLSEALATAGQMKGEWNQARVFIAIVPHLDKDQVSEALIATRQLAFEGSRAEVLTAIVPYLDEQDRPAVLSEALAAAKQIKDRENRAALLIALVPYLDEQDQPAVLSETLTAAGQIRDAGKQARLLSALAPHLDHEQLSEALAASRQIRDAGKQAEVLTALAPHLDQEQLSEALAASRQIRDAGKQAEVLTALAPHLDQEQFSEALTAAGLTKEEWNLARIFIALVPHLDKDQLSEVLTATTQLGHEGSRSELLTAIVPHLDGILLPKLDPLLSLFLDVEETTDAFSGLHKHGNDLLVSIKRDDYELLTEVISRYAQAHRKTLLQVLNILLPQFKQLGGTPLLLSIFDAIQKTATWWP